MMKNSQRTVVGAFLALFVLGVAVEPSYAAESKCDAAKVKAAGKKLAAKANCHAKALQKDAAVDPTCLTKAEEKFDTAFQKANAKNDNCTTSNDAATVESMVDAFLGNLVSQITVACDVAAGELDCSGTCVDAATDEENCGDCGIACAIGEECVAGSCQSVCAVGETDCSGTCVITDTDPDNCGGCGNVCAVGETCQSATCVLDCGSLTNCSGVCVDLATDENNCGLCGNVCPGGETCIADVCTP